MLSRLGARWLAFALLGSALLSAVSIALTWANGHLTRQVLQEQARMLEADPAQPWRMEIEELVAGFAATSFRLGLYDHLDRGPRLEVSGRLEHRLLTTSFTGNLYAMPSPQRRSQDAPVARQGLASFRGQARYRPIAGVAWSARVQGQGAQLGMGGLDWTLEPWSAELEGGESGPQLSGRARVGSLELRLPQGFVEASDVSLEGQVEGDQGGWPFGLRLVAAEVVYKGFPFTRLSDLIFLVDGRASPVVLGERRGVAADPGSLAWRSSQSLQADSDYGPLQGKALASGTLDPSGVPRLSELHLTGMISQGLWSVLERLNAGLAAQVVGDGLVKLDGREVRVRAEYRGGGWRALVTEP